MLLLRLSLGPACILRCGLFVSSFMQASSSSSSSFLEDNDGDWSLFSPFSSTEDYGLTSTAAEEGNVPSLQSNGDVDMDFSGSDFFSSSGKYVCPQHLTIFFLSISIRD